MTPVPKEKIGFIQKFFRDMNSPTGYSVTYLIGDIIKTFPCTEEYWNLHLTEEYIFPLITEVPVVMEFNENGYACGKKDAKGGEDSYASYGFGCPKGFGYLYRIEGNRLVVDGKKFNELLRNDRIAHYGTYHRGTFEAFPEEDVSFEMTDDIAIYCLDFYGGDRCQKKRDLWYLNDVLKNNKNCYWLNIYDFWNGEGKIDMVVMFRQPPKDENATAGNLDETGFTREYRFWEATGSFFEDEKKD